MQMPTFEEYNNVIDQLLQSFKYIKFNQLLLRQLEKFFKMLGRLFEKIFNNMPKGNNKDSDSYLLQGIFVFLAIMAILALIIFIVKARKKKKKKLKTILGEKIEKNTTIITLQEKSQELERLGAFREAVRYRYIAVLFYLHQKNILYHDASMTGKEMVIKLRKDNYSATRSFAEITQEFNGVWYGVQEMNSEQFIRWTEDENIFWQEATK